MPFKSMGLHPVLVRATAELGYGADAGPGRGDTACPRRPGRDRHRQTGTGKTAAFLLPLLHRLLDLPRGRTRALILSPTRELAEQIEQAAGGWAAHPSGPPGGRRPPDRPAGEGPPGRPGRGRRHPRPAARPCGGAPARLDRVATLVLDEADSMLDMGFLPDVKRIIARLPARRQTLLFSATMPPVIAQLAGESCENPATVQIGRRSTAAVGITQAAYPVPTHLKTALLRHLLRETEMPSVLVFTRTKHAAKKLARVVAADGFKVAELHSNRTPAQRTKAMDGFRRGEFQVMVATNIAARGLDVDHITHVISMDVPDVPEDYVHRIGRTGRAGAEGDAFILVSPDEEGVAGPDRAAGRASGSRGSPCRTSTTPRPPSPTRDGQREARHGRGHAKGIHKGQSQPHHAKTKGPSKFQGDGQTGHKGKARHRPR